MSRLRLLVALVVASMAAPAVAEVYKWVDAQGRVHYGDRPGRADAQALPQQERSRGLGVSAEQQAEQERLLRARREERAVTQAAQQKAAAERAQREHNCAVARERYAAARNARYLYERQADGGRRVFSHEERRAAEERAAQDVRRWCGS